MYEKKNLTHILTILESIEKIDLYTRDFEDADVFFERNDQMHFNACQALLLVIGEESKKIEAALRDEHPTIPWNLIAGLRNRIAHDYRSIDPYVSFDVIRNYLPDLKKELMRMLRKVDFEKSLLERAVQTPYYAHLTYLLS
ncbi:MAG: HepT-like ribonuclease domain-containing protein [Catalinimonas sp.]